MPDTIELRVFRLGPSPKYFGPSPKYFVFFEQENICSRDGQLWSYKELFQFETSDKHPPTSF